MNLLKIDGISRSYLRLAATYRRFAGDGFDFSKDSLIECFNHESYGATYHKTNGYVYGKWCKDISLATWKEDLYKGDACKSEFYYICGTEIQSRNGWWCIPALQNFVMPIHGIFGHSK